MFLHYIMEWPEWESLAHMALAILYVYIFYKAITDPSVITVQNILLFMIVLSLDTIIHQNINNRSHNSPKYFFKI